MGKFLTIISVTGLALLFACSPSQRIGRSAERVVLNDPSLKTAHVGISIYEPATDRYWYNHAADKYFVPASNVKIPTCYAAMKYLGDSLVGLRITEYQHHLYLSATADPSFLHPDFRKHPVFDFLRSLDTSKKFTAFGWGNWRTTAWGSGWSWGDYDAPYMAERSAFPIYGNLVSFSGQTKDLVVTPGYFKNAATVYGQNDNYVSRVERSLTRNEFLVRANSTAPAVVRVPFVTTDTLSHRLLMDTLHIQKRIAPPGTPPAVPGKDEKPRVYYIYSQLTDSLLKPMMHRSDNFFAEQSLLMAASQFLGVMNEARLIDTLLKTGFKDLPQRPRWSDGSGLSRYNLFTPQDFVVILEKMRREFGMERIKEVFPTGNEGTLTNYYKSDSTFIYAKTGTLSGVVALSGFLYTKKNRLLVFSVLVNNHQASAAQVRRAVEKFIQMLRNRY